MKKLLFLLMVTFLFAHAAQAGLMLDIAFVNKKGIDKGLVLVNELHSTEEMIGTRPAVLTMKDNLRLEVVGYFVPDYGTYGPSTLVWVYPKIFSPTGVLIKDFTHQPLVIPLGKTNTFIFGRDDVGQSVEISVTPKFI